MMNLFKKKTRTLVCAFMLLITLGSATTINAATAYPDGGTWNYGVGVTGSYSDYYHPSKYHCATVVAPDDTSDQSCAPKKQWAKARLLVYSGYEFYYSYV